MSVNETVEQILRQAYESCAQIMPVKECWLYGSYARGDFNEWSDIDILISVDLPECELRQFRRAVAAINSRLSLTYDVTVSITVRNADDVEKYSRFVPFYQNVLREGQRYAG